MTDHQSSSPRLSADQDIERRFDQAVAQRRRRTMELRKVADLESVTLYVDGERREACRAARGVAHVKVGAEERLIEVFSGVGKPVHLASLHVNGDAMKRTLRHRLFGESRYSLTLEGGIKVKFRVSDLLASDTPFRYAVDIKVEDVRQSTGEERAEARDRTRRRRKQLTWAFRLSLVATFCVILLWQVAMPFWQRELDANRKTAGLGADNVSGKSDYPVKLATPSLASPTPEPSPMQKQTHKERARQAAPEIAALRPDVELTNTDRTRSGAPTEGDEDPIKLRRSLRRIVIKLPAGSRRGIYTVTVETMFGQNVVRKSVRSADGKTLNVPVDIRSVDDLDHFICVSRGDEAPLCRTFVVTGRPGEGGR